MNRPLRLALVLGLFGLMVVGCGSSDPAAKSKPAALEPKQLQATGLGLQKLTTTLPTGESLRYSVSVPRSYDPGKPAPLIVALHYGYDGSAPSPFTGGDMIQELVEPALGDLGAVIVAPDALGG